jgi:hypothetical protein
MWRARQLPPREPEPPKSPPPVKADSLGFVEPEEWPVDNGHRREPVLDADRTPPRVVRYVGWRSCLRCRKPFFSRDVQRVRLCDPCKEWGQ